MKKVSWNNLNSKIKLISLTAIVLMIVQMLILLVVSNNRQMEHFNSQASEAFSNDIVSLNETIDRLKETTLSFSQQKDIYYLFFDNNVDRTKLQSFVIASKLLPEKISSLVQSIYIFNGKTQEIYSNNMSIYKLDSISDSETKRIISSGADSSKKLQLFVDKEMFFIDSEPFLNEQVLRICYFPSKLVDSCLIFDININSLLNNFSEYNKDFSSDIFLASRNIIACGTGSSSLQSAFGENLEHISSQNFNYPVFRRLDNSNYLILKKLSQDGLFHVYSLIPAKSIPKNNTETQMLFSVNMCLIILLCLAVVMFFLFKNFNQTAKENANLKLLRSEDQITKQFARKKECLVHCLINPNERDFLAATEYIQSFLQKNGNKHTLSAESLEVSLLRIEIDNYKSFSEAHTTQDAQLYKYGMLNICEEILNTHTKAILIYEKNEEAVFLIIDNKNPMENCRRAIEECRTAVKEYIDTDFFAFMSVCGKLTDMPTLNKQTIAMSEYVFMLDEPDFLTTEYIKPEPEVSSREAMDLLEAIFNAADEETRDEEFNTFFEALNGMRPDEAKNVLWIFMFRLHNIGKRNPEETDSIEILVAKFNEIKKLSEMYEFFTDFSNTVFLPSSKETISAQDNTVLTVQAIIERDFRLPDFCGDHIADEMNSSKVYLSRKYKNLTGTSISEEILNRRMTAFAHELLTTKKSIKTIIADIGGANYNYYMALFKKRFAMTPTEYRKNHAIDSENTDFNQ